MALSIIFPDGSVRRVIGQLKEVSMPDGAIHFIQIPANCDPLWRYEQALGQWYALPRDQGRVTRLTRQQREWWQSILPMTDSRPDSSESAAA